MQTPHHNADAWRRHWDDAPELPDKIYIEARKRAEREGLVRSDEFERHLRKHDASLITTHEGDFGFAFLVVICLDPLESFVEAFIREHPEPVNRPIVE